MRAPPFGLRCSALFVGIFPLAVFARPPLGYLSGAGPRAYPVLGLTWGLIWVSIAVSALIALLVLAGVWRRRAPANAELSNVAITRRSGMPWLYYGVSISTVVLFVLLVWTVAVLAKVNGPPSTPELTLEVTGEQWWWRVNYLDADPARTFTTANEIHIPVGQPVRVKLTGADVIHSFWVPALGGKMDAIPGQTNVTWMQADAVGRYRGQCTEYCGVQHAHMALEVVAEEPKAFQAWREAQLAAAAPAAGALALSQHLFEFRCGACHTVRGTDAGGSVAPDLTHLMSRATLAAGELPNTPGALSGWLLDPQGVKPGTHMPRIGLSGPELADVRSYLETLK